MWWARPWCCNSGRIRAQAQPAGTFRGLGVCLLRPVKVTRGRLLGKRHISARPLAADYRWCKGPLEGDTVIVRDGRHSALTL
jgi:hypothetical protein